MTRIIALTSTLLINILVTSTSGFSILHNNANALKNPMVRNPTHLYSTDTDAGSTDIATAASKFYQLEEKEDKESSTTEIFLSSDGTVTLAETDGPPPLRSFGTWSQNGDNFEMQIKKTFGTGQKGRDVGEFEYEVARGFVGVMTTVGGLVSVDGAMHYTVS